MKKFILVYSTLCLTVLLSSSFAQAESWGFLGGMHRWEIKRDDKSTYPSGPKFSTLFGVALFHQSYPLELDILYANKEISNFSIQEKSIQLPFLYRANITKEFIFGLGGFFDYDITDRPSTSRQKLDIGVATSFKYQVPFGKSLLAIDGRYLFGTTDIPGKSRDLVLLVGLLFK